MPRFAFGDFELCTSARQLLKNGRKIRVQPQPMQALCSLVEHAGEPLTREQLAVLLWGRDNAHADVDQGLNIAIRKLRDALGDSAEHPLFIEMLPRHGYRFVHPVR